MRWKLAGESPYEETVGFSRTVRVGRAVFVAVDAIIHD
jgi:hypothetical protein